MATFAELMAELDQLFGFFFDAGMAFHITKERLEALQKQGNLSDASFFMFGDGEPKGPPEQVLLDSLHSTNIGAIKVRMSKDALNAQRAAQSVIVFTYHIWEEKYRRSLVDRNGTSLGTAESDVMGDLRLIRNAIIHNKGVADSPISRCKVITHFIPGKPIVLTNAIMSEIIRAIRSEFAAQT